MTKVEIDRSYLRALEFEAFAEKSRGNLQRQKEVRELLNGLDPLTDYEELENV